MYGTEQVFNQRQLDSAFVADTLDSNLENWLNATFVDYETNEKIVKYLYIKENTDSAKERRKELYEKNQQLEKLIKIFNE